MNRVFEEENLDKENFQQKILEKFEKLENDFEKQLNEEKENFLFLTENLTKKLEINVFGLESKIKKENFELNENLKNLQKYFLVKNFP